MPQTGSGYPEGMVIIVNLISTAIGNGDLTSASICGTLNRARLLRSIEQQAKSPSALSFGGVGVAICKTTRMTIVIITLTRLTTIMTIRIIILTTTLLRKTLLRRV